MNLFHKTLILCALPGLTVLSLATQAGAATVGKAPRPHVAHMPAAVRGPAARPAVVTGTQTDTYVAPGGTDAPLCLQAAPCATISYAETQTAAGGTIHVADGNYNQTADLTQPVNLVGQSESGTIIDGSNLDYTPSGYYGVLGIDNTSGTPGTISISDLTVQNPYITAAEASDDQEPADIANYDQQAGDTVQVSNVTLGPAQDEADYAGIGYYSLNAVSANVVTGDSASGMYQAYFAEGTGGQTTFAHDAAVNLAGYTFDSVYYPAVGVWALSDDGGGQSAAADRDSFTGYNGWGIVGQAGYPADTSCSSTSVCSLTITTSHNTFSLTAAPASDGVSAIQAYVLRHGLLKARFSYSSGTVESPDKAVTVVDHGGKVRESDAHDTIVVTQCSATARAAGADCF